MSIATRINRLEEAQPTATQTLFLHWANITEETTTLVCAGQEFHRQEGEALEAFTERTMSTAQAANPERFLLWMDAPPAHEVLHG